MLKLCASLILILTMCTPALSDIAVTGMGGADMVLARFGYASGDWEVGAQVTGILEEDLLSGNRVDDVEWEEGYYGLYGTYSLGPVYAGAQAVWDFNASDDGGLYGPVCGLKASLLDNLYVVAELQYVMYSGILRDERGQYDKLAFVGMQWRLR